MLSASGMNRSHRPRSAAPALAPIFILLSLALPRGAYAAGPLPSGGHFVAGTGSINGNSSSLTIKQTSTKGVIDWTGFSIGNGNHVSIINGTGATLNRVTGSNPSSILGTLSATGSVYLINPQGIVIGSSGVVSTGGRFVASTLDTTNAAFMNGGPLTLSGTSNASVVNLGHIASSGGDVFLVASHEVENLGTISASQGTVELAAGRKVLLRDSSTSPQVLVQTGSVGTALNRGTIQAAQISLQAADGNVFALAGNHAVLRATGTASRAGHVWLVADTGKVTLDGTIEARNANGSGGVVDISAAHVVVTDDANGKALVTANRWNITAPSFTIGAQAAPGFQRSLDAGTSINLETTGAGGARGNIDVASSINWTGAASLTLGAYRSLTIEAAATLKNSTPPTQVSGNLTLRADSTAIDNGGSITNKGTVDWSTSYGIVSAFYDMNGSFTPGKLLSNVGWVPPGLYSGLVTQITAYKLVNTVSDLEKVGADLASNYALGRDIDASAMKTPIGSTDTPFTGQFDGKGHTIGSLNMVRYSDQYPVQVGLFGSLGPSAVVRNLNINGSIGIGGYDAGAETIYPAQGNEGLLAADNYGTILRVNTSGSIQYQGGFGDFTVAGGLVGLNDGTIERSSSSVNVTTGGALGGLVGENGGTGAIDQSYASGSVTGFESAGRGLYSQAVPGGLVGVNGGGVTHSYATGAVSNSCQYIACSAGGLVATNDGNGFIGQSFATGAVTINAPSSLNEQGRIGAIAAYNGGTIGNDVYWNKDTTGVANGVGTGTPLSASNGLTTAQMSNPASFSGWDFSSTGVWALPTSDTHPILRWQLEPPVSD